MFAVILNAGCFYEPHFIPASPKNSSSLPRPSSSACFLCSATTPAGSGNWSKWSNQKERERKVPIPAYSISAFLLHTLQPHEWCKHSTEGSGRSVLPLLAAEQYCAELNKEGVKAWQQALTSECSVSRLLPADRKTCKEPLKHITVIKKLEGECLAIWKTKTIMVLSVKLLRKGNVLHNSLLWWLGKLFAEQVDTQILPKYSRNRTFPLRQSSFAHWSTPSYEDRKTKYCIRREKCVCLNGKGEVAPAQGERKWHSATRAEALGCAALGGITAAQPGTAHRPAGNHFKARREWASSKPDSIFSLCLYV